MGKEWRLSIPLEEEQVRELRIGDVVYLTGDIFTGRSLFHIRAMEQDILPPIDFEQLNVMVHIGPVLRLQDGVWHPVSMTPTASLRFERYGADIVRKLGLRAIVGKTTMGERTMQAMTEVGCVHVTSVGVCGNTIADQVVALRDVYFREELNNTEATWVMAIRDAGPFIVDIDTTGANLFRSAYKKASESLEGAYERYGVPADFRYTEVGPVQGGGSNRPL